MQRLVAGQVPVSIVVFLKPVQVDKNQRQGFSAFFGQSKFLLQLPLEKAVP